MSENEKVKAKIEDYPFATSLLRGENENDNVILSGGILNLQRAFVGWEGVKFSQIVDDDYVSKIATEKVLKGRTRHCWLMFDCRLTSLKDTKSH